jgi:hypothetical protein
LRWRRRIGSRRASASSVDLLQMGSSSRATAAVNGWLKLASNIPSWLSRVEHPVE